MELSSIDGLFIMAQEDEGKIGKGQGSTFGLGMLAFTYHPRPQGEGAGSGGLAGTQLSL